MQQQYFWDDYDEEWKKWFFFRLVHEKYIIDLLTFYSTFIDEEKIPCETAVERTDPENRERFLVYLLSLLQEGRLKVKIRDLVKVPYTDEQKRIDRLPLERDFWLITSKKDHLDLHPHHAINMIREKWNSYPTDFAPAPREQWTEEQHAQYENLRTFEEWGVLFTLPENGWGI